MAVIFVPIVLAYQAWSCWVFRQRLGRDDFEGPVTPISVLERRSNGRHHDRSPRRQAPGAATTN